MTRPATRQSKDIRLGDDVRLLDGPWAGHEGKYIEDRPGIKLRRVVLLENGEEAFVTNPDQWERVTVANVAGNRGVIAERPPASIIHQGALESSERR